MHCDGTALESIVEMDGEIGNWMGFGVGLEKIRCRRALWIAN